MRGFASVAGVSGILMFACLAGLAKPSPSPAEDHSSVVIVFKDGHRQSLAVAEIVRIDVKAPASILYKDGHREKITAEIEHIEFGESGLTASTPSRAHFLGKWEVGEGANGGHFFITLEANGDAKKSLGEEHGTWTWVDGEARVTWDDGWHDAIRKVGAKHEKLAHEPGKSFDDPPSNVTEARKLDSKPI